MRTKNNIKPLFVSVGHLVTLDEATQFILSCTGKYRLPEPTRMAHLTVTKFRKEYDKSELSKVIGVIVSTKNNNHSAELKDLKNQLKRKINEMHSMQQIGKTLSSVLDRDRLLILIMDEVTRLMDAERGTLYIVENEKGELWSKIAQKAEIKGD